MATGRFGASGRLLKDGYDRVILSRFAPLRVNSVKRLTVNSAKDLGSLLAMRRTDASLTPSMTGRFFRRPARFGLICTLALPLSLSLPLWGRAGDDATPLKLLISIEQQSITASFPARVTLHLHNAGQGPLWLYRKARTRPEAGEVVNGSSLGVRLEPVEVSASRPIRVDAVGTVLESVGLPRPKLVRLAPDDDYEEKVVIQLEPARAGAAGGDQPLWGRYRFSVTYGASYGNAGGVLRSVGISPWQGEVSSNTIEIELLPPAGQGSLSGRVINAAGEFMTDARVSLSDEQERLIAQVVTGFGGRFSFARLPAGLYWVTSRLDHAAYDTSVFRHVELTPSEPAGNVELVYVLPDVFKGEQMLHKPVLLRVFDEAGRPWREATLEISFMDGTVVEDKKLKPGDDGIVATELIPGLNYVTLKRRRCAPQELRVEVAAGDGIDAFKLVSDCASR